MTGAERERGKRVYASLVRRGVTILRAGNDLYLDVPNGVLEQAEFRELVMLKAVLLDLAPVANADEMAHIALVQAQGGTGQITNPDDEPARGARPV